MLAFETFIFFSFTSIFWGYFQIHVHWRQCAHARSLWLHHETCTYALQMYIHGFWLRICFFHIYMFKVAFDFTYRWVGMGLYACIYALFAMICRKSKVRSLQLIVSAVIFRVQGPLMHWTVAQTFAIPNWSQRYLPRNYCIACDTCLSWIICEKLSSWYYAIDHFRFKI